MNIPTNTENPSPAADVPLPAADVPSPEIILATLADAISHVEQSIGDLRDRLEIDTNLTGHQRKRLFSVRARNYGFITTAYEIAAENPDIRPPRFSVTEMEKTLEILDRSRHLLDAAERLRQMADDFVLKTGDRAYHDGLRVHGSLRELSGAKVAGADILFRQLSSFFARPRRRHAESEPTQHELERDFHRLTHGTADGEMIIKHESPRKTGGVHEIIDDVHKHGRHGAEIKVKSEE